jgi:hypothetical protein
MMTALAAPAVIMGCAARVDSVYDPYYGDYHTWNDGEVVYYHQWEHDTHRHDEDFCKRSKDEQKEYFNWRHNQGHDNDHH